MCVTHFINIHHGQALQVPRWMEIVPNFEAICRNFEQVVQSKLLKFIPRSEEEKKNKNMCFPLFRNSMEKRQTILNSKVINIEEKKCYRLWLVHKCVLFRSEDEKCLPSSTVDSHHRVDCR